jgi:hypothetical protein
MLLLKFWIKVILIGMLDIWVLVWKYASHFLLITPSRRILPGRRNGSMYWSWII